MAGLTYRDAGVDIAAGNAFVEAIKAFCPKIGGFGGVYPLGDNYLVAGTDGVGTKLKLAFAMDRHDTIGIDLVAMSVNDVAVLGAKPLFFLDYFATSKLDVRRAEGVVRGIAAGCAMAECVLLGGETAEMPGFYHDGEYDLAGFAVGIVAKDKLIDGRAIVCGDRLVGFPSSGVHSNGFSLVRAVLDLAKAPLDSIVSGVEGTLGEALLKPTAIYSGMLQTLMEAYEVRGAAHITGGGLVENVPRIFPKGLGCVIDRDTWEVPPLFRWLQKMGNIGDEEMFRTFNMGIGMVVAVPAAQAEELCRTQDACFLIGEVIKGQGVAWR